MGGILIGSAIFLIFGWWFFATYANPKTLEVMFLAGSIVLALWGGWRLGRISKED